MREDRPTLLASLIARDERTQEEVVAGFEQCARDHGEDASLSLRTLRRWMLGDVRTQPRPTQRRVARIYWGHSMDELLAPAPSGSPSVQVERRTGTASAEVEPVRVTTPGAIDADVDPPAPPEDSQHTLERQVAMSTRRAVRFTTFAEARNAGPEAIAQLGEEIGGLASDYIREPIVNIMGDLVQAQDAVFSLLEGRQRAADRVELYMLAGVVSGLLAKASHDLGKAHDAMTQARTMYVCADNADHPGLRVWARGLQSLIAYWAGRPQEAVRYAQAGTMILEGGRGTVAAWLPSLEARALAQLGNTAEARSALRRAYNSREAVMPDELDRIGGLLTFPQAKQHYYAAGALVSVEGGDDEAAEEAVSALELYEDSDPLERSFSDIAGARAELALSRVHVGEIEGAREALAPMLGLDPTLRIGGIITSAERVHHALRDPRFVDSVLASALRDEIEAFCQVSASALSR
jgi:tetratricopeptide (TPR) repeat protein